MRERATQSIRLSHQLKTSLFNFSQVIKVSPLSDFLFSTRKHIYTAIEAKKKKKNHEHKIKVTPKSATVTHYKKHNYHMIFVLLFKNNNSSSHSS